MSLPSACYRSFFFNDTATTEIYTLSLHDALPIFHRPDLTGPAVAGLARAGGSQPVPAGRRARGGRSEEHTSELHSRPHLACRLLLEEKNTVVVNRNSDYHLHDLHALTLRQ